jgi:2-amino-4-hydroxy-6-hydroxymethyldihydropteridine diphosphokinase
MGRVRDIPKGPRRIDLDILLYDTLIIDTERLVIPHPGIPKREFLLAHLIELEPALRDPLSGEAYSRMLARLRRC